MDNTDYDRAYANVIARVSIDPEYRATLLADPVSTLRAEGIEFPEGVEIEILETSATKGYLVIPNADAASDEILSAAAGGGTASTAGTAGSLLCFTGPSSVGTAGSAGSVCS